MSEDVQPYKHSLLDRMKAWSCRYWLIGVAIGALWVAALLHGGIYQIAGGERAIYKINRFTGSVWFCLRDTCRATKTAPAVEAPKPTVSFDDLIPNQ